ncbi:30S ribosomal protein S21 [Chloroflexota bacterium]
MADVKIHEEESFDSLLRRFNKKVQQDGILSELRRHEHFEKPSIRHKRKKVAKKRNTDKAARVVK